MLNAPGRIGSLGGGLSVAEVPTLSGSVLPTSRAWLGEAEAWVTGAFTLTISNATGTPTVQWEVVNNAGAEILITNDTGLNVTLESVEIAKPVGATVRAVITDDLGVVPSNTVATT